MQRKIETRHIQLTNAQSLYAFPIGPTHDPNPKVELELPLFLDTLRRHQGTINVDGDVCGADDFEAVSSHMSVVGSIVDLCRGKVVVERIAAYPREESAAVEENTER
jgi:hypothetical protein